MKKTILIIIVFIFVTFSLFSCISSRFKIKHYETDCYNISMFYEKIDGKYQYYEGTCSIKRECLQEEISQNEILLRNYEIEEFLESIGF